MNIPINASIHLLHQCAVGTLASLARQHEGYPYPTVLPFIADERHRPTILISRLAEHTHNLLADSRAGFLVYSATGDDVLSGQRLTLVGRFMPAGTDENRVRRYLRYHPDAERYLALNDFSFFTMEPQRLRYIGGFGAMGWLDAAELDALPPLGYEEERELIAAFDALRPPHVDMLGVDYYGADLLVRMVRTRIQFDMPQPGFEALRNALVDCAIRLR